MPKRSDVKKVLVIGSGPIVIGQAAEFDYAGTQACRALKEEGLEVVLVNSNPATIMTDKAMADKIYIEPLTVEVVKRIIDMEQPDSVLSTLGGQTGLNLGDGAGRGGLSSTPRASSCWAPIPKPSDKAEDRQAFKDTMLSIGEPCIPSKVVETRRGRRWPSPTRSAIPVIVRPAYTLGGTGGGIAHNDEELREICAERPAAVPDSSRCSSKSASPAGRRSSSRSSGTARATCIDRLLDGEHRPGGRPHRRLHRGRPGADPVRPGVPACCAPRP